MTSLEALERRNRDLERRIRRVIRAANQRIANEVRVLIASAVTEADNRRLRRLLQGPTRV